MIVSILYHLLLLIDVCGQHLTGVLYFDTLMNFAININGNEECDEILKELMCDNYGME